MPPSQTLFASRARVEADPVLLLQIPFSFADLSVFRAVATLRHRGLAAESLYVAPFTVHAALKRMEKALEVPLVIK